MNETGTAARAWMNPTEAEQRAEAQIRRPSFRLILGLEKTGSQLASAADTLASPWAYVLVNNRAEGNAPLMVAELAGMLRG